IDVKAGAHVRRALYRVAKPRDERSDSRGSPLEGPISTFLNMSEHWVHRTRPQPRRMNIRPYVDEITLAADDLTMALWITPNGAARPEEVVAAVGLQAWLDAGAVIERTDLEIYDELPADVTRPPVMTSAQEEKISTSETTPQEAPLAARPTAIFDSPFSFDS